MYCMTPESKKVIVATMSSPLTELLVVNLGFSYMLQLDFWLLLWVPQFHFKCVKDE